ncbi:hypothetical protein VTO73DRAFT_4171 [Trametes versicolor]
MTQIVLELDTFASKTISVRDALPVHAWTNLVSLKAIADSTITRIVLLVWAHGTALRIVSLTPHRTHRNSDGGASSLLVKRNDVQRRCHGKNTASETCLSSSEPVVDVALFD